MVNTILKRQFITDADGNPVAVILPLEQFALVEEIVERHFPLPNETAKLEMMEQAAGDPRFLSDLRETMTAYSTVDGE